MKKYVPKFVENKTNLVLLDNIFDAHLCIKYAKEHNMKVLMECTTSTSSVEVMMLFQKNGFIHTLFEKEMYAPDGIKLPSKVLCLFEQKNINISLIK